MQQHHNGLARIEDKPNIYDLGSALENGLGIVRGEVGLVWM